MVSANENMRDVILELLPTIEIKQNNKNDKKQYIYFVTYFTKERGKAKVQKFKKCHP